MAADDGTSKLKNTGGKNTVLKLGLTLDNILSGATHTEQKDFKKTKRPGIKVTEPSGNSGSSVLSLE